MKKLGPSIKQAWETADPISLIATALQIVSLIGAILALFTLEVPYRDAVAVGFIGFLLLLSIVLLVIEEFRWHRKARYAEAMEHLHQTHHKIRDTFWHLTEGTDDKHLIPHLKDSLKSLSAAFSMVTGVHCRVCIKLLLIDDPEQGKETPRPYVETLVRHDDAPKPEKQLDRDYIEANSDFWELFVRPERRFYFSNNLAARASYRNTHWPDGDASLDQLPYVATVVWPIRKMVPSTGDSNEAETLAFLCVDTKTRNVFSRKYDPPVGSAVADALYVLIRTWRDARGGSLQSLVARKDDAR